MKEDAFEKTRHSGESRNPVFLMSSNPWTPAFAGVTSFCESINYEL